MQDRSGMRQGISSPWSVAVHLAPPIWPALSSACCPDRKLFSILTNCLWPLRVMRIETCTSLCWDMCASNIITFFHPVKWGLSISWKVVRIRKETWTSLCWDMCASNMHQWLAVYCWDKTRTTFKICFGNFCSKLWGLRLIRPTACLIYLLTFCEASMESAMFSMIDFPTYKEDEVVINEA